MADKNFEKERNMKFIAKEGCEPEPELLEWIEDNYDECCKAKTKNLYEYICNVVEHYNYISSVDLYDGADDLVYSADSLKNFIKAFGMVFLSINTVRKAEYYDDICHLDLYANEIIGQETIDEVKIDC
mgnify:FL=1